MRWFRHGRAWAAFMAGLAALLLFSSAAAGEEVSVRNVIDGDTILLTDGRSIRYIGINTPEMGWDGLPAEPFARSAKRCNAAMAGRRVHLAYGREAADHYGRCLAHVYAADGRLIAEELLSRGLAYCLPVRENMAHHEAYLEIQRRAMLGRRGIWQCWAEPGGETYVGNRYSKRFHRRDCPFGAGIGPAHRILFPSRWDAFYAGYAPCAKCMPRGEILAIGPGCPQAAE